MSNLKNYKDNNSLISAFSPFARNLWNLKVQGLNTQPTEQELAGMTDGFVSMERMEQLARQQTAVSSTTNSTQWLALLIYLSGLGLSFAGVMYALWLFVQTGEGMSIFILIGSLTLLVAFLTNLGLSLWELWRSIGN